MICFLPAVFLIIEKMKGDKESKQNDVGAKCQQYYNYSGICVNILQ